MPRLSLFLNAARVLPMLGVMGAIFYLSHQPGDVFNFPEIWSLDKILHAVAYGFLAATVIWAFPPGVRQQSADRIAVGVLCLCLTYGISDELHQSFIPGRFPSSLDVVADFAGSMIVVLVWRYVAVKRKTRIISDENLI